MIIAGGGPSGTTLGYELSRRDVRTLLLEKALFPRYKTCAGGIPIKVTKLIPIDISPVIETTVHDLVFTYKLGAEFMRHSEEPLVYTVERSRFDSLLLEKAREQGLEVFEEHTVKDIEQGDGWAMAITDCGNYKAKVLVGADGANGPVARSLGLIKEARIDIGLQSEISVRTKDLARFGSKIHIDWGTIPSGYGWVFPKKDHLSVGIGGPAALGTRLQSYLKSFTEHKGLDSTAVNQTRGHKLPTRRPGAPIVKERVMLVGDSAGLVDPFTGEGIFYAIKSAQLAADTISRALSSGNIPDQLVEYEEAVDNVLMPELMAAQTLMEVANCFPRLIHRLIRDDDRFWRVFYRIVRGERAYTDVIRKLGRLGWVWSVLDTTGTSIERRRISRLKTIPKQGQILREK